VFLFSSEKKDNVGVTVNIAMLYGVTDRCNVPPASLRRVGMPHLCGIFPHANILLAML
jgi:hypothetical protein